MVTNALIPTSGTDVLTALSGQTLAVVLVTFCNTSSAVPVTVDAYVIPTGGSANDQSKVLANRLLRANDSLFLDKCKFLITSGDKIRVAASVGNIVSAMVSYITI